MMKHVNIAFIPKAGKRNLRSISNHLFIINGIIHEHKKSKTKPVTIQILDYSCCFDSLWQDEVTNELFDAGVDNDKLALLHKINETNHIRVKTSAGLSDVKTVKKKNIICQGDPWGSIECGVIIDGFGKESLNPELEPYHYKNKVPVPLLGMVDDTILISESGYKTSRLNAFINAKTAVKRLQFGKEKCHVMYVGKDIPDHKKIELHVDGWKMHEVQRMETGQVHVEETFDGEQEMTESTVEKYLGQVICNDGSNVKNVATRSGKGMGMISIIENIINNVPGGKFHFKIAVMMRNAYLISSMLSCCEVWYEMTKLDLRKLEQTDEKLNKSSNKRNVIP